MKSIFALKNQDHQCCNVIENGDYEMPKDKAKDKWDEPEFKLLEKMEKLSNLS